MKSLRQDKESRVYDIHIQYTLLLWVFIQTLNILAVVLLDQMLEINLCYEFAALNESNLTFVSV